MTKHSVTSVTALPAGTTREAAIAFLHDHYQMMDLNPLIKSRNRIDPPSHALSEEHSCVWYSITDKVSYLPGGLASGQVTYTAAFHDLPYGLQTHCYAPMGVETRSKWTIGGSMPGEPAEPLELGIGAPKTGLYLREDVDLRCNLVMAGFVKKTLKKSHATLVERLADAAAKYVNDQAKSTSPLHQNGGAVVPSPYSQIHQHHHHQQQKQQYPQQYGYQHQHSRNQSSSSQVQQQGGGGGSGDLVGTDASSRPSWTSETTLPTAAVPPSETQVNNASFKLPYQDRPLPPDPPIDPDEAAAMGRKYHARGHAHGHQRHGSHPQSMHSYPEPAELQ